jgi:hypothetical protein
MEGAGSNQQYVILMNRAIDPRWLQDGIYLSLTKDISDPMSWTETLKTLSAKPIYRNTKTFKPAQGFYSLTASSVIPEMKYRMSR